MRVLVLTDQWFPDLAGGAARVASETASRLARRGHEVCVLAPRSGGEPADEQAGGARVLRLLPRTPLPQTLTDVVGAARRARPLRGFDVALVHQVTLAEGLRHALPTLPVVQVFHAPAARELRFVRSRLERGPQRLGVTALEPLVAALERRALARASRVAVLSEFTRGLALEVDPGVAGKLVRVSGGVDVETFAPRPERSATRTRLGARAGRPLLLTVRRLEPRMGIAELLHALRRLPAERRPLLAIAGTGPLAGELRRLRSELRLDDDVRFLGRVPEHELHDWYRAADLFVLPTVAYEGFGLVTAEALASGTPVVGTSVGATPELLRPLEPRLVARGAEPAALADAITMGLELTGPTLRRRCRRYACETLSWDAAVPAWERALVEAATRPDLRQTAPGPSSGAPRPEAP